MYDCAGACYKLVIKCQKSVCVETDANTKRQDGLNNNQDHKQKKQTTHYKYDGLARVKERRKVS